MHAVNDRLNNVEVCQPPLTLRGEGEVKRRQRILARFAELTTAGMSGSKAAKRLGVSPQSIWRWKRGIFPLTAACGRKAKFQPCALPPELLKKVRALRLAGLGAVRAWRLAVADPDCPAELREFVQQAKHLPPSLLNAVVVTKKAVTLLAADGTTVIQE